MVEFQPSRKELHTSRVLVLCAIVILLEGFDIQAAGVSATKLALAFQLDPFGKRIVSRRQCSWNFYFVRVGRLSGGQMRAQTDCYLWAFSYLDYSPCLHCS